MDVEELHRALRMQRKLETLGFAVSEGDNNIRRWVALTPLPGRWEGFDDDARWYFFSVEEAVAWVEGVTCGIGIFATCKPRGPARSKKKK